MKTNRIVLCVLASVVVLLSSARAAVVDTFDGPSLNPMWVLDADPAAFGSGGGFVTNNGDGVARFNSVGNNAYAHIQSASTVDTTAGLRVDAIMRQDNYPVGTWGMGVGIYFDANNWVAIKQGNAGGQSGWMRDVMSNGTLSSTMGGQVSGLQGYWLISGVELTATQIKFYGSPISPKADQYGVTDIDAKLSELMEFAMARPAGFTGPATIILGKGYTGPGYGGTDFDNSVGSDSYAFAGIDYARITTVPEPATLGLLVCGLVALLRRRR